MPHDTPPSDYLTVAECASALKLAPMTIYRMVASGQLAAIRTGYSGRAIRILRVSFEEHQRQQLATAPPAPVAGPGQIEIPA